MHEPGMLDREERVYGLLAMTTQDPPWAVPLRTSMVDQGLSPQRDIYTQSSVLRFLMDINYCV